MLTVSQIDAPAANANTHRKRHQLSGPKVDFGVFKSWFKLKFRKNLGAVLDT
jgi:hypothetical protein